jgi:hypothetical protein
VENRAAHEVRMRRRRRHSPTEPNAPANRQRSGIDLPGHTRIVPKSPAKRHSESKALSSQKLMKQEFPPMTGTRFRAWTRLTERSSVNSSRTAACRWPNSADASPVATGCRRPGEAAGTSRRDYRLSRRTRPTQARLPIDRDRARQARPWPTAPDSGTRRRDPPGQRMPPHHRRRLLLPQGLPALNRRTQQPTRIAAILDAAADGPPDFTALGEVMRRHGLTPAP